MSNTNNKNFVNFHILISHSPSNLNRDDMGIQKTAIFGGVKRTRVSSQSLKRAIRTSEYYKDHLGQPSIRTRELKQLLEKMKIILGGDYDENNIKLAIECLSGKKMNEEVPVAAWIESEVQLICEKIKEIRREKIHPEEYIKAKEKKGNKKKSDEELKEIVWDEKLKKEFKNGYSNKIKNATDIALSGRMTTSGIMTSIDGALAVAHAITTHAVDSEIDWFTAVDDLKQGEDSEDKGSAHLDTTEFSSGVFYRYASLNLQRLQKNIGDEGNRSKALEIASHVLHLLTTVTPSAKQNSFAAHNLADFALVTFSNQPLSFANAFEIPIKSKAGLLKPSIFKLLKYQQEIKDAYGLKTDPMAFYSVQSCSEHKDDKLDNYIKDLTDSQTLEKLKQWLCDDDFPLEKSQQDEK